MKAKLLPIAIGAVLAGGMTAASADVTVFGHIDTSIDSVDETSSGDSEDDVNLNCTTCSIGFKGSEDLGNGLKAIFKLDFQYDTTVRNDGDGNGDDGDNDNSGLLDRDQWLGLSGSSFGSVKVGTISTVYKSHGAMIDPLYRTSLQGRSVGLQSGFHSGAGEEGQGRATNTIRWDSANYNGVKIGATYTLDSDEDDGEDENPIGIGASYSNGDVLVFADWLDNGQSDSGPDGEESAWKAGGKYTMGDIAIMGQYESFNDNYEEFNLWHIAGSYTMGNNMIYVAYGEGESDDDDDDGVESWTIAGVHTMSKRTSVYAGFTQADCEYSGEETHSVCDNAYDGDRDQFSVGMKHKF